MQKTSLLGIILSLGLFLAVNTKSQAQSDYRTALGLGIDFGTGPTLVGPSLKHFFSENNAGQFEVLFGNNYTQIGALYQYHKQIPNATGLKWYLGAGAGFGFYRNRSHFILKPVGGLDYKINNVPLSFAFDWRPSIFIGEGDSDFEPARFGFGFRYAF